jgi:hypothetical protein
VITLRNPSNTPQIFSLFPAAALELPTRAAKSFTVRQPFASSPQASAIWQANRKIDIALKPFEVQVYESDILQP